MKRVFYLVRLRGSNLLLVILLVSFLFSCQQPDTEVYFFSYFKGNGEDGLHLAYSMDGFNWQPLNKDGSFLTPRVGEDKLMRDPCIIQAPDGKFHMVWTVSWHERGIGYAHSSDLVHWSEQKYIPVMAHEAEAKNCWAPEIFFDDQKNEFLIFWATTIPGRFPETDNQSNDGPPAPGNNHRIYATTTKDFNTFSETRLFFDYGFNVIDATIIMEYGRYFMFIKDETNKPFMTQKNIRLSTSAHANGPWSQPSPSITGKDWVEGPTAIRINNRWHLYFDKYMQGNYGCLVSDDLLTWRDKSAEMVYPKGMRHGSVFKGSKKLLDRLVSLSPAEIPGVTSRVISD